jgi:hypothetical protein
LGLEKILLLWTICNGFNFGNFHMGNIFLSAKISTFQSMAWMNTIEPKYNKENIFLPWCWVSRNLLLHISIRLTPCRQMEVCTMFQSPKNPCVHALIGLCGATQFAS